MSNYIYLLHLREFINSNEPIFKLGKSKQENLKRFNSYPKGSKLLFQIICDDCDKIEKDLIKLFKINYEQQINIGIEYFKGNYKSMINDIFNHINGNHINNNHINDNHNKSYEELKKELGIKEIIIINQNNEEGFIKYDNNKMEYFNNNTQKTLSSILKNNYLNIISFIPKLKF